MVFMFDHGDDEDATSPDHFGRRLFRRLRQVPDESVPISSAAAGMVKAFLVAIIVAITCAACEAFTGESPIRPADPLIRSSKMSQGLAR